MEFQKVYPRTYYRGGMTIYVQYSSHYINTAGAGRARYTSSYFQRRKLVNSDRDCESLFYYSEAGYASSSQCSRQSSSIPLQSSAKTQQKQKDYSEVMAQKRHGNRENMEHKQPIFPCFQKLSRIQESQEVNSEYSPFSVARISNRRQTPIL